MSNSLNNAIGKALMTDPLGDAEQVVDALTGSQGSLDAESKYKDLAIALGFMNLQENVRSKEALLSLNRDFYRNCDIEYAKGILREEGFIQVAEKKLTIERYSNSYEQYLYAFWHKDGALIGMDTSPNTRRADGTPWVSYFEDPEGNKAWREGEMEDYNQVNVARMFFNYYRSREASEKLRLPFTGCHLPRNREFLPDKFDTWREYHNANDTNDDWKVGSIMVGHIFITEGFRYYWDQLREHGEFLNPWYCSGCCKHSSIFQQIGIDSLPDEVRACVDVGVQEPKNTTKRSCHVDD